jgi:hypothetical protein
MESEKVHQREIRRRQLNGVPIPRDTPSGLAEPALHWVPAIAPGSLIFYRILDGYGGVKRIILRRKRRQ